MNDKFVPKDRQEAFDAAAKHLLKTGEPSISPSGLCRYGGTGCAMRPFLGDDTDELKGMDEAGALTDLPAHMLPDHVVDDLDFYQELQDAHDTPTNRGKRGKEWLTEWELHMRDLADKAKLSTAVFDVTE